MATIGDLVVRVALTLQDIDHQAWSEDEKKRQVIEEIQRLSRLGLFGEIVWRQGIVNEPISTLPLTVIDIYMACYNGNPLHRTSEQSIELKDDDWELRAQRPQYYSVELQTQTDVRLIPAPLVTGSSFPVVPPLPLIMPIEKNCVFFTHDNPQTSIGLEQDCKVPDSLEDVVVCWAAAKLSGDAGDYQDLEKSMMCDQIARLFLSGITDNLDIE